VGAADTAADVDSYAGATLADKLATATTQNK